MCARIQKSVARLAGRSLKRNERFCTRIRVRDYKGPRARRGGRHLVRLGVKPQLGHLQNANKRGGGGREGRKERWKENGICTYLLVHTKKKQEGHGPTDLRALGQMASDLKPATRYACAYCLWRPYWWPLRPLWPADGPRRSRLTKELNSVTLITYVLMLIWLVNAFLR